MKLRKLVFLSLIAISSAILSGCASDDVAHKKSTLLGLYTYEPACFTPTSPTKMSVRTDEIYGRELPSGDRTQFLWGLITIEDY